MLLINVVNTRGVQFKTKLMVKQARVDSVMNQAERKDSKKYCRFRSQRREKKGRIKRNQNVNNNG